MEWEHSGEEVELSSVPSREVSYGYKRLENCFAAPDSNYSSLELRFEDVTVFAVILPVFK